MPPERAINAAFPTAPHLAHVALDEVWLEGDALVGILEPGIPGTQLGIACCPVAVKLVSLRVDLGGPPGQGFAVVLDSLRVLLLLEGLQSPEALGREA